jgi:3-oxoadipate enol-lactonase
MAEELKRDIPVSRVRVIPDTGHWLPVEDPGSLAAAILEFLS